MAANIKVLSSKLRVSNKVKGGWWQGDLKAPVLAHEAVPWNTVWLKFAEFNPLTMVKTLENMAAKETEPHLEKFGHFEREAKNPPWVFPLRKAGISRFAELGFPTVKLEDWRFTNVAPITKLPFKPVFVAGTERLGPEVLRKFAFHSLDATRLVFVDGHWSAALSSPVPEGFKAGSLAAALITDSALLERHLGRYAQGEDNAFTSLNAAFFQDGAF